MEAVRAQGVGSMAGARTIGRKAKLIALACSVVASVILVEVLYREYLRYDLARTERAKLGFDDSPTYRFIGFPPPWTYNAAYGWDFLPGGWRGANIAQGAFDRCVEARYFNLRGNIGSRNRDFENAKPLIFVFGSSFTMTHDDDGRLATEILEDDLRKEFPAAQVENLSRDSFGVLQMFDMAVEQLQHTRPTVALFVFNTSDVHRPRHWRSVVPSRPGFWRFYQAITPEVRHRSSETSTLNTAIVITDRLTPEWCDGMTQAKAADAPRLREDALVRDGVAEFNENRSVQTTERFAVDFSTLKASFLWNRIARGNEFHDMEIFSSKSPLAPIQISDFHDDPRFVAAAQRLEAMDVPYFLVHLPAYPEMRSGEEYAHGSFGVPAAREKSLIRSLEGVTRRPILSLLPYVRAPRDDAGDFVHSAAPGAPDWHPNAKGTKLIADALRMLVSERILPASMADADRFDGAKAKD
jgi:hypothetical protein